MEIELERRFLAKYFPEDLNKCKYKDILDIYIPERSPHPNLRIRKRGEAFEITKKEIINGNDSSEQREHTISLTKDEFDELAKIQGKRLHKNRFYYPYENGVAEIDVYLDDLAGLIVVDFEFSSREEMEKFKMPNFCLVEVTQDRLIAGGMLAGKRYDSIKNNLEKYNYKKLWK